MLAKLTKDHGRESRRRYVGCSSCLVELGNRHGSVVERPGTGGNEWPGVRSGGRIFEVITG